MEERLQKVLARAGYGSRRSCEDIIKAGRVRVNGEIATLGCKVNSGRDKISVDQKPINDFEQLTYIAFHKPRNVLSSFELGETRRTIKDYVPVPEHVFTVGRLDNDSEGLMLLTNDGELTNRLTHPRYGHEKEYRVLVARRPDKEQLDTWRRGVVLPDGHRTSQADVRVEKVFGKGTWLRVIMREGRKRQIREIGTLLGLPVVKIIRIRIQTLMLGSLAAGKWRYLTESEISGLKQKDIPKKPNRKRGSGRKQH